MAAAVNSSNFAKVDISFDSVDISFTFVTTVEAIDARLSFASVDIVDPVSAIVLSTIADTEADQSETASE